MVIPAFISAMSVFENSRNGSLDEWLEWLMPAVPVLHGLWYLAYLACFHIKQLEGDSYVPHAWRSVLYLDAFGWARHSNPTSGTQRAGASAVGFAGRGSGQPAMDTLSPSVPCRPEDVSPQQLSNNRDVDNASFKPSSFSAPVDMKDEDGEDFLGAQPGELPWLMYKWTTVFLACLWFWAGANGLLAVVTGHGHEEEFSGSRVFNHSASVETAMLGLPQVASMQGLKIETRWSSPLVRPRGLDCDSFGAAFVTSGLDLNGKSSLFTSAISGDGVIFNSSSACLDTEDVVQDFATSCTKPMGCRALVFPRKGEHLIDCPLVSTFDSEMKDSTKKTLLGAGRTKSSDMSSSMLHRAWLDDRGAAALDNSLVDSDNTEPHDHPEEISALRKIPCTADDKTNSECVVVGTTGRRVVLLKSVRSDVASGKTSWVPQQVLNHDIGEVPGPGAFALIGGNYLGVLLRNEGKVKMLALQGGDSDSHSFQLPSDKTWDAICAGAGHIFAMESGTNPSLWKFAAPQPVASAPIEAKISKNDRSDTAVALDPIAQWSFPQDAAYSGTGASSIRTSRYHC